MTRAGEGALVESLATVRGGKGGGRERGVGWQGPGLGRWWWKSQKGVGFGLHFEQRTSRTGRQIRGGRSSVRVQCPRSPSCSKGVLFSQSAKTCCRHEEGALHPLVLVPQSGFAEFSRV